MRRILALRYLGDVDELKFLRTVKNVNFNYLYSLNEI